MNKILELREKRAKAWEAAKAFLDTKRGADGLLAAEDVAAYAEGGLQPQAVFDLLWERAKDLLRHDIH